MSKLGKFESFLDAAIDRFYDICEPVAGTCPVCALWRGVLLGCAVTCALVLWLR